MNRYHNRPWMETCKHIAITQFADWVLETKLVWNKERKINKQNFEVH